MHALDFNPEQTDILEKLAHICFLLEINLNNFTNFTFLFIVADALLADLQNTVPGQNGSNGQQNGTPGYGCLKGARRKEPQVVSIYLDSYD